jgi:UDP-N-acetylglucosamine--N-acetylmuramyl-(pentapeptide) pyrophosphoryl-undecaprenol N-acetylglucosamine transferase
MKVVIAGGGTAGHVFPAIALGRVLADRHGVDVRFLGTDGGLEARLVPKAGFRFTAIEARPLRRELSLRALAGPVTAVRSYGSCMGHVEDADAVVGVGGYVSVPPILAAIRARRPIVLHEQNAVPGLANRLLGRRAHVVALSFATTARMFPPRVRTVLTGNPVRDEILGVPAARVALAAEAAETFDLSSGRRTVLVFGGSQGALSVNRASAGAIDLLRARDDVQMLVLTGPRHLSLLERAARGGGDLIVRPMAFLERMELAYAAADLVVARSGATTIAELTVCGLPSILVPYPHHRDHQQEVNARAVERAGGAVIVPDRDLSPERLARLLQELTGDEERRAGLARGAADFGRPDAAEALAAEVLRVAGEHGATEAIPA